MNGPLSSKQNVYLYKTIVATKISYFEEIGFFLIFITKLDPDDNGSNPLEICVILTITVAWQSRMYLYSCSFTDFPCPTNCCISY